MFRLNLQKIFPKFSTSIVPKTSIHYSELEAKQLVNEPNELRNLMIEQIKQAGQLKIPDYWRQALTDQTYGYYRHQNVFAKAGDFITSPEISPLFGQMIATWIAVFLQNTKVNVLNPLTNNPQKKFRIVELGGGRGMLMQDILKSFHSFKITNQFDLCFIEISQYNRKEQQKNVMEQFKKNKTFFKFDHENATQSREEFVTENQFKDMKLRWYSKLEDLLKEDYEYRKKGKEVPFTVFIMNEFFDALPITILEYTPLGWRQKVLKLSNVPQMPFELTNSDKQLHQKLIPSIKHPKIGDCIEISPESFITMDMMAKMIKMTGGGILNIDYGGQGPFVDSIRAIKSHKYINSPYFWQVPGICDISAHVSFSSLAQYAQRVEGVKAFDLIPQGFFLQTMGIQTRYEILSKSLNKTRLERLQSQVKRLTAPEEMGQFYQVQIITLKEYGEVYPHINVDPSVF